VSGKPGNYINRLHFRYGRLVVIGFGPRVTSGDRTHITWRCLCDCGRIKIVRANDLSSGATTSCGCFKGQVISRRNVEKATHRDTKSIEYIAWGSMKRRCSDNPSSKWYADYFQRGIRVCERWQVYENFLADMGRRPLGGYSLDRIDNDGDYEPSNCRWATHSQQMLNRRPFKRRKSEGLIDEGVKSALNIPV
jgi:hypothetical protein